MSRMISPRIENRIFEEIARHPDGLGVRTLCIEVGDGISRRSLQRRLAQFVADGRLITVGAGRALRYCLAPITGKISITAPFLQAKLEGEIYVPLSDEGRKIKDYIRQPRHKRRPVSYNQNFLEEYRPNEATYLSKSLLSQLHSLGRSSAADLPAGTFAREILGRLLIDLSWASSRLEGNTYTLLDTERLIKFGQAAEGKDALETQMILNHKSAIELLVNETDLVGFKPYTILNLHALLSDGLLPDPRACGRVRSRAVEVGGSVYLPIAMPQRVEELFRHILATAEAIDDPFEQAFFVMVHLPYLQPFEDVNKRVSRIAANIPLIKRNLCPLSFIDVPERAYIDGLLGVYELNRIELLRDVFTWAYERSCQQYVAVRQTLAPPDTFRLRYREALTEAIRDIVLGLKPVTTEMVHAVIPASVVDKDYARFVELVLQEFENLYEGNASRFRLRPSEFAAWQEAGK